MYKKQEVLINEPEILEAKISKRRKIAIAIITSLLVITATALFIGYYKFDLFNNDNYKIDANISRKMYQANYFSEKKTINAKFTLPDGVSQSKDFIVDTNFVVFLTDKKDKINTAVLVILNSQATVDEKTQDLPHLNLFDEEEIKDLAANPNGAQYPLAVFKFDDDGKIEEIQVPNNMDEYHAEFMNELIEYVIPKLSRSKQEDMSKGLDIKTTKSNNKRTIVQTQEPKIVAFLKGSKYSRTVCTEIEDEQLKNVKANSDIYLQSQPEEGQLYFGPKDFKFNMKSQISLNEEKYNEKEFAELAKKIADKFNLVNSNDLLESIRSKKEEEKKEEQEEPKPVRNLFEITAKRTIDIAKFDVLGQEVKIYYEVSVSTTKAVNQLVIKSGLGTAKFGNEGCSASISKSYPYNKNIIAIPVPGTFGAVTINCYATGSLSWAFGVESGKGSSTKYYASISGILKLGASVKVGIDELASLSAYAEGTVFDAKGKLIISQNNVANGTGFSLSMGQLVAGVKGKALFGLIEVDFYKCTLYKGWKVI